MVLPRKEKLKDRAIFRNTRFFKVLLKNDYFKLIGKSYLGEKQSFPKIAFVVSKKKIKKAVGRNRAKRLTEEAYRLLKPELATELYKFEYLIFFLEEKVLTANLELIKEKIQEMTRSTKNKQNLR